MDRITVVTTKGGDDGMTSLANGTRTPKTSTRISAVGTLDELNCEIGLVLADNIYPKIAVMLLTVQNRLFDIGSEIVSVPMPSKIDASDVKYLDDSIETLNADLPPLKDFVLPGGSRVGALLHKARAVSRRAEREYLKARHFSEEQDMFNPHTMEYLNRLSDLLFVAARTMNQCANEVVWEPKPKD